MVRRAGGWGNPTEPDTVSSSTSINHRVLVSAFYSSQQWARVTLFRLVLFGSS